jgi:hypothetical protein
MILLETTCRSYTAFSNQLDGPVLGQTKKGQVKINILVSYNPDGLVNSLE